MKNKTSKLRNLEKNRYSILTENLESCYICGSSPVDIHEIYGGSNRKISMQNGFCLPVCRTHHRLLTDDNKASEYFKQKSQGKFEETHERKEFMNLIGKNYL